jgi:hypothetical protein
MFRLIHQTSCTVGIDEAQRYHNPKDPGMQQICQLLSSGYKQGMHLTAGEAAEYTI